MNLNKIIEKLNQYEDKAYKGECGADYLSELGEGFKSYLIGCLNSNVEPTIQGFVKWIDRFAKDYLKD